ncbi:MAG TPA: prepilin-type N-terminal cleavage/methylation domain-containing protein [Planctomycetota bacterium]|nr:prepilin-type N-terminal cleavage/methylation domain-containing protein [Planctomycetota bacterium]
MHTTRFRPRSNGFTLIELLVAITISVMLLSILAMVFKLATQATRDANLRISTTERLRALNIRMRQEIGNMLDTPRPNAKIANATYDTDANGTYISFATSTDEDGRPVNVDVKYVFKAGQKPEDGALIRRRDLTGPYVLDTNGQVILDSVTGAPKVQATQKYILGDEQFFEDSQSAEGSSESTVMMTNVRQVMFRIIDPPLAPTDPALRTLLNPRTLPAAIEMQIQYGPVIEGQAATDANLEWTKIVFPIYKGL